MYVHTYWWDVQVPDVSLIAEVILYSEGFQHAKDLGHKVCQVYGFSRDILTPQRHYDWGLRALKTILGTYIYTGG